MSIIECKGKRYEVDDLIVLGEYNGSLNILLDGGYCSACCGDQFWVPGREIKQEGGAK